MGSGRSSVELKRFRMLRVAALVLPMAFGFAAAAAAEPTIVEGRVVSAPAGVRISVDAESSFVDAGTNPRITDAVFATTEYHDIHEVVQGRLFVRARTAAQLNALPAPPDNPFEVDVTITMTNDEGDTASGTITFRTAYARTDPPPPPAPPSFVDSRGVWNAPAGFLVNISVRETFINPGAGAQITDAVFSTTEYYKLTQVSRGRAWVEVKTDEELGAMSPQPPNPFTVDVTVTMTNDAGQTASGTITLRTAWTPPPPPPQPTLKPSEATRMGSLDVLVSVNPDWVFDNAGTNPRITSAVLSPMDYVSTHTIADSGFLYLRLKTAEELNAMSPPPPSPFEVDVTVTMTNDEEQTATGTITIETVWFPPPPGQAGDGN